MNQTLQERLSQVDGAYTRRIHAIHTIPGGLEATLELVTFRNVGNQLRPVIMSDEALSDQAIATGVPNRPSQLPLQAQTQAQATERIVLRIEVLTSQIVRIRLLPETHTQEEREQQERAEIEHEHLGMLLPDIIQELAASLTDPWLQEDEQTVHITVADLTITLYRDPFALRILRHSPSGDQVVFSTAEQDRDVHGFLCTPPPGQLRSHNSEPQAFWSWSLTPDEHLYGLGERFASFDQRGKEVTLWTLDAWGTTTAAAYKSVPFLLSSQGYGLFFHTTTRIEFQLGSSSARAALAQVDEPTLDLFAIFGETPKEILGAYTQLTGRATVPPRWALGIWLSRCRYQTRAEVEQVVARARAEQLPCDVIHIDPAWLELPGLSCDFVVNETAFPDLPGLVQELAEQHIKVSLWELPYISARSRHFKQAVESGFLLRDAQGEPICADFGAPTPDGILRAIVDFTNPAARAWWQDLHRPLLRAGVAVFKTDFGEGVPLDAHAWNGMTGQQLHNLFPLLYQEAVHEVIAQETGRDGFIWGRSGWAGIQRYPAQWGGDPKTDTWSMRSTLRGGLQFAVSAPGIWSHDIGGFYGPQPGRELYIRWSQFGLLSPLARAHGTTPREPWEFGEEALANFKRYATLRMRLNPYLYTTAWEAHEHGWPMLRPLYLEFPHDPGTALIDDVYMLGSSLLIAPIFAETATPVQRTLYLPEGGWFDFWDETRHEGGRYITRNAPLDTLPIFVKAGSILPSGADREYLDEEAPDEITLDIYVGAESVSRLVWNNQGEATTFHLHYNDDQWQLTIRGERAASWKLRWHGQGKIVEAQVPKRAAVEVYAPWQ